MSDCDTLVIVHCNVEPVAPVQDVLHAQPLNCFFGTALKCACSDAVRVSSS